MQTGALPYQFSQKQLKEYQNCPQILFTGNHIAGIPNCVYCAQIFRRYHQVQMEKAALLAESDIEAGKDVGGEGEKEEVGQKSISSNLRLEDDDEDGKKCTKLICARAGWCMCE